VEKERQILKFKAEMSQRDGLERKETGNECYKKKT
jgi:hypothetical protein